MRSAAHARERMASNERKTQTLNLFERAYPRWLTPSEYAWKTHKLPARSAYSYLQKLWKWGLLERLAAPIRYRITARGRERLAYLRGE